MKKNPVAQFAFCLLPLKLVGNKIKKIAAIATLFFVTNYTMHAQSPTVTLTPSQHNGYNITCFGKTDGSIIANVTGACRLTLMNGQTTKPHKTLIT
ncbi:MAG: hypothetical protein IPP29_19490 [Bacteroidetes bacterium]|nr:hypothetical protein [Bacteroidota bacterium]